MRSNIRWIYWAGGAVAAYSLVRAFRSEQADQQPKISKSVAKKLPTAKPLRTIPDAAGNYDIDGVSFDSDGVIVSSDASKPGAPPLPI